MIYAILLDTISKTLIYYTTTTLLQSTDGCERSPGERVLLACGEGLLLKITLLYTFAFYLKGVSTSDLSYNSAARTSFYFQFN